MDARRLAALLLAAALILAQPVHVRSTVTPPALAVGLGFGPDSVEPTGSGIPVFAVGDQLWFRTYSSGLVNVTAYQPVSGGIAAGTGFYNIPGNTTVSLITFSSEDPTGTWTLQAITSGAQASIQFLLVGNGAPATLSGYKLEADGNLDLTYDMGSLTVYDLGGCSVGGTPPARAEFSVPSSVGGGTLAVGLDGNQVTVAPLGGTSTLYRYWMSLTQDYSFETGDGSTFYTRSMEVAATTPVEFSPLVNGSFSTTLEEGLPIRPGVFTLSANFQGQSGSTTEETQVLITGTGSWIWLEECSSSANPTSDSITVASSLQAPPESWPRTVYLLYEEFGVELFSVEPVTVQPAVIQLSASGFSTPLTDDQIEVTGGQSYAAGSGDVYIVGLQYPLQVTVSTPQSPPQQVEVAQPYSITEVNVSADQVVVKTLSGSSAVSGAEVRLTDSNGTVAVATSTNGEAVFYVPPGDFGVLGTFENLNASTELSEVQGHSAGQSIQLTLQFGASSSTSVTYFLLVFLVIGVAMNVIVWAGTYMRRRRGFRIRPTP